MATLLRIDSSARTEGSHSRVLADEIQSRWLAKHPGAGVIVRDLASEPIGPIAAETITGFYTPPEAMNPALQQATALSDQLIGELMAADTLLLSVPMYNFSVPAALKAWIDQIVRIGHTFSYDEAGFHGLVKDKQAYVVTAIGAQFSGTPFEAFDFLRPYLKSLLGFLGFEKIEMISLESTTMDETQFDSNKRATMAQIENLFTAQGVAVA